MGCDDKRTIFITISRYWVGSGGRGVCGMGQIKFVDVGQTLERPLVVPQGCRWKLRRILNGEEKENNPGRKMKSIVTSLDV